MEVLVCYTTDEHVPTDLFRRRRTRVSDLSQLCRRIYHSGNVREFSDCHGKLRLHRELIKNDRYVFWLAHDRARLHYDDNWEHHDGRESSFTARMYVSWSSEQSAVSTISAEGL